MNAKEIEAVTCLAKWCRRYTPFLSCFRALLPARGVAVSLDLRNPVALQGVEQLHLPESRYTLTLRLKVVAKLGTLLDLSACSNFFSNSEGQE